MFQVKAFWFSACEVLHLNICLLNNSVFTQLSRKIKCHSNKNLTVSSSLFYFFLKQHKTFSITFFFSKMAFSGGKKIKNSHPAIPRASSEGLWRCPCAPEITNRGSSTCRKLCCLSRMGTNSINCKRSHQECFPFFSCPFSSLPYSSGLLPLFSKYGFFPPTF